MERFQKDAKCATCIYADTEAVKKHLPCCTYWVMATFDEEGRCLARKEVKK